MQSPLENVQVNKRSNGGGSLMWVDVVAICGHQLSGLALVPTSITGGTSSTATEKGTLSVLRAPSSSWGEASSSLEASKPVF